MIVVISKSISYWSTDQKFQCILNDIKHLEKRKKGEKEVCAHKKTNTRVVNIVVCLSRQSEWLRLMSPWLRNNKQETTLVREQQLNYSLKINI